ncbi:uncharacterized protein BT62DRAFT_936232, partial [Guyanagaster necrorhizus]
DSLQFMFLWLKRCHTYPFETYSYPSYISCSTLANASTTSIISCLTDGAD